MKMLSRVGALVLTVLLTQAGASLAESARTSAATDALMQQALLAIDAEEYLMASQLLTKLVGLPEDANSARAQELLGNVREANGQLAHAKAEYEIYLEKYPDGDGAARVRARLSALLSGAGPTRPSAQESGPGAANGALYSQAGGMAPNGQPVQGNSSVRDSGRFTLTYRYNEGAIEITDLAPDPDPTVEEDEVFDNSLTSGLQFTRLIDNGDRRIRLSYSGITVYDFEESDGFDLRASEAFISFEDKPSGRILTFGRQRLFPQGIAYRTDGLSLKWPTESGIVLGLVAGAVVESTRDGLFEGDQYLIGTSAEFKNVFGQGDMTIYAVSQRDSSFTYRNAIGAEYSAEFDQASAYANVEYDLKFKEVNRALLSGAMILGDGSRVTGRLSFYRSPSLNLENALIGQSVDTIDDLLLTFTNDEIEGLAVDRSANITTLGLTYYGKLNETWDIALDGTLYQTSGTPASGGVAATDGDGVRSYFGGQLSGSSVFMANDNVSVGLRFAFSDANRFYVADTSMRIPVTDALTVAPRLRVGYRDFSYGGGEETFVMPSVSVRYRINRATQLQLDAGGRWLKHEEAGSTSKEREFFLTAGISRSF